MKSLLRVFLSFAFILQSSTAAFAQTPTSSTPSPAQKSLAQKISQSLLRYREFKDLPSKDVDPKVVQFLTSFLVHLEIENSEVANTEPTEVGQARHLQNLKLYEQILESYGEDERGKGQEFLALASAIEDPTTEEDDLQRKKLLEKYHDVTNLHLALKAEATVAAAKAASSEPKKFKPNWEEVLKTIGTYSLYGLCMVSASYALNSELHVYPIFSEVMIKKWAVFALASGPFGFFHQLYLHTWPKLTEITRFKKEKRRNQLKAPLCSKAFSPTTFD